MDVVSAFLASKLEEKIYMEFPDGFKNSDKVGLLGKSIYRLKQSARYFNCRFHDGLLRLGFIQTIVDPCVYVTLTLVLSLQSGWTTFFYSAPVSIRSTPSRRHLRKVQHERCWRVSILPRYSGQSRSHQQDDYH